MNTPTSTPNVNRRIHHAVALNVVFGLLLAAVAQAQEPPAAPVLASVRLQSALTIQGQVGTTNWILVAEVANSSAWRVLTNLIVTQSPYVFIDTEACPLQRYYMVAAGPETPPMPVDPSRWVYVPPRQFKMGSPEWELDRDSDEGPETLVTFNPGFYMGRYEVTQAEYVAVMGSNPSHFIGDPNRPVEMVSWDDAVNYCAKLTVRERAAGRLPAGYEYRLPTEAQWECACRADTTTRFSYGNDVGYTDLIHYGWFWENSASTTHPVGQKRPNPWGLYDMHGNVAELCSDWYEGTFHGENVTNPYGPSSGTERVRRGGLFNALAHECRSADRGRNSPSYTHSGIGFRAALVQIP